MFNKEKLEHGHAEIHYDCFYAQCHTNDKWTYGEKISYKKNIELGPFHAAKVTITIRDTITGKTVRTVKGYICQLKFLTIHKIYAHNPPK